MNNRLGVEAVRKLVKGIVLVSLASVISALEFCGYRWSGDIYNSWVFVGGAMWILAAKFIKEGLAEYVRSKMSISGSKITYRLVIGAILLVLSGIGSGSELFNYRMFDNFSVEWITMSGFFMITAAILIEKGWIEILHPKLSFPMGDTVLPNDARMVSH